MLFFKAFQSPSFWENVCKVEGNNLLCCFLFVCSQQLEKELLEQQLNVNSLQELTAYLLLKSDGDYIEEEEKVHVIGTKLKQLVEQVSHDLKTIQGNLVSWNLNTRSWIFFTEKKQHIKSEGIYKKADLKLKYFHLQKMKKEHFWL